MTPLHFWYLSETLMACTPLLIGFVAGYVAYRQWRTSNHRLKLDLFDRRLKVYAAAKKLIDNTIVKFEISDEDLRAFNRDLSEAEFLFPLAISQYIRSIANISTDLRSNTKATQTAIAKGDRDTANRLSQKELELVEQISVEDNMLLIMLREYMSFESIK